MRNREKKSSLDKLKDLERKYEIKNEINYDILYILKEIIRIYILLNIIYFIYKAFF